MYLWNKRVICAYMIVSQKHDDVIKWKHFPRYWPFVRGIHRWPMNSPHKGQWLGALMFSLICTWINSWVNNLEAVDLRHHRDHYDVIVMESVLGFTMKLTTFQQVTFRILRNTLYLIWVLRCQLLTTYVKHYTDVIMSTMASHITSLTVVYSIVYFGTDQRKHQSSASLAFVRGIHRDRWIPSTKGQ